MFFTGNFLPTKVPYEMKYTAEEKEVGEASDEDENFKKTVSERRNLIEKRLSIERTIPASSQRVEIVQEISSIKRQSLVEDKIAEVEEKHRILQEPIKTTVIKTAATQETRLLAETVGYIKAALPHESQNQNMEDEKLHKTEEVTTEIVARRDSDLLEGVTQRFEIEKVMPRISANEGRSGI